MVSVIGHVKMHEIEQQQKTFIWKHQGQDDGQSQEKIGELEKKKTKKTASRYEGMPVGGI